jgi:hypothetical protein
MKLMKFNLFLIAFFISNVALATNTSDPNTGANLNLAICNTVSTTATANGPGVSTSNAGIATGATGTIQAASTPVPGGSTGTIAGSVNTFSNGFANNVSTGGGAGTADALGVTSASVAGVTKGVSDPAGGSFVVAGKTSNNSASQASANTNQSSTAVGASASGFEAQASLTKVNGVTAGSLTDSKSAQSIVNNTGPGSVASAGSVTTVTGNITASNGVPVPTVECSTCF